MNAAEGGNPNAFDIIQGFVQYARGPLTLIAGKFVTLAGPESIDPTLNTNFSRSFLFYAEPLTHTGIRATYALSDTLSLIAGVNNGWNYASLTTSGSKTGELGVAWNPSKAIALALQGYAGKDQNFDAQRSLIDGYGTYNATDALSFVLNFEWGRQTQHASGAPDLNWNGVAFYTNYAFNKQWRVSVRIEYLNDQEGFVTSTGIGQTLKEGTVTFGYDPAKNFELRLEARYDRSSQPTFLRSIETDGASLLTDSQTGFAIQGLYKF